MRGLRLSGPWPIAAVIVVGALLVALVTVWFYPAPHPGWGPRPASFYLSPGGRTYYVAFDSGKREMWTSDGQVFYLYPGTDVALLHRAGDVLVDNQGRALLHIARDGRVLEDNGLPLEVEEGYYLAVMKGR